MMNVVFAGVSPSDLKQSQPHKHSYWEIVLYLEGSGTHYIGDKKIPFKKGQIICQPPEIDHYTVADGTFRDIFIGVEQFELFSTDFTPVCFDDVQKRFQTLMWMIHQSFYSNPDMDFINCLYSAMHRLLTQWADSTVQNKSVEKLKMQIIENISNSGFDLTKQIEKSGYCSDHIRRCFKKYIGMTPNAYLINMRLEYSRRLLVNQKKSGMTIGEIAKFSGFEDQYYFSRMFKKRYGVCPSEFSYCTSTLDSGQSRSGTSPFSV